MPTKPLLRFLSLSLLLIVYTPFAASMECFPFPPGANVHGTFTIGNRNFTAPVPTDCLHIVSVLPSSLHVDPSAQAAHGRLALEYGRLASHRFDMQALFRHKTCELHLMTELSNPHTRQDARAITRQEMAYYFWNHVRTSARNVVNTCMIETRHWMGHEGMDGDEMGFTEETLATSRLSVVLGSAGYIPYQEGNLNVYNV